jgi:hypothetical protein
MACCPLLFVHNLDFDQECLTIVIPESIMILILLEQCRENHTKGRIPPRLVIYSSDIALDKYPSPGYTTLAAAGEVPFPVYRKLGECHTVLPNR